MNRKWKDRVTEFAKTTFFKALITALVISAFVFGILRYNAGYYAANSRNVEWGNHIKDSIMYSCISKTAAIYPDVQRISDQYVLLQGMKKPFFNIAFVYSQNQYALTVLFTLFSIVLAILAFIIASIGWSNVSNWWLKLSFFFVFFYTSSAGILIQVLNHQTNTERNLQQYAVLNNMQLDLYSFVNQTNNLGDSLLSGKIDTLIVNINTQLQACPMVYFESDIESVPNQNDLIKTLSGGKSE